MISWRLNARCERPGEIVGGKVGGGRVFGWCERIPRVQRWCLRTLSGGSAKCLGPLLSGVEIGVLRSVSPRYWNIFGGVLLSYKNGGSALLRFEVLAFFLNMKIGAFPGVGPASMYVLAWKAAMRGSLGGTLPGAERTSGW